MMSKLQTMAQACKPITLPSDDEVYEYIVDKISDKPHWIQTVYDNHYAEIIYEMMTEEMDR